ncbi:DMT family transporter [Leisingera thetidis]|uniref:DMT family transporter n=1 Tax=Leisingera thetidis TaxID=2930199 RepID=UPI0021F7942C|nr:DMT family transporter [Leisingera thetidis]
MPAGLVQRRAAGVFLVVVSAAVFSSAGIFTRSVTAAAWAILFWRGLAAAGLTLAYLAVRGQLAAEVRAFDRRALLIAVLGAAGSAAFIPAFKLSSVANVALIYAAAPFAAAGLAWLTLRERPRRRVVLAGLAALGGVAVIVSGPSGQGSLAGDGLALFMTLMMAAVMTAYRKWPGVPAALPNAAASLLLLPVAAACTPVAEVPAAEMPLLILFGLVFAVASVTLCEGARRLPAAETALLSALETPLAPLLAFLILAERPGLETLAGGAVIFTAVLWAQKPPARGRREAPTSCPSRFP